MSATVRRSAPMTIEEFHAFTDGRPDEEKWELLDGEPVLNASPSYGHQRIVRNTLVALARLEDRERPAWEAIPGIGVKLSETSAPEPDLLIRPRTLMDGRICTDVIVAIEILSPSTARRDLEWKRNAYATLPALQHYAVIDQGKVSVSAFDRATGWQERRITGLVSGLDLPVLGIALALADLYDGTGLDPASA